MWLGSLLQSIVVVSFHWQKWPYILCCISNVWKSLNI